MGVNGCSFESLLAAASESFESLLLLFELLFELEPEFSLFELFEPDDDEEDEPPPTRFWMKSCKRPHSACLIGIRQAARHNEQATTVTSLMGPNLMLLLLLTTGPIWLVRDFILQLILSPSIPLVGLLLLLVLVVIVAGIFDICF